MKLPAELVPREPEARKAFLEGYQACADARNALADLLTKKLDSAIMELESKNLLESPNYTAAVADNLGYRRGLRYALTLLRPETDL